MASFALTLTRSRRTTSRLIPALTIGGVNGSAETLPILRNAHHGSLPGLLYSAHLQAWSMVGEVLSLQLPIGSVRQLGGSDRHHIIGCFWRCFEFGHAKLSGRSKDACVDMCDSCRRLSLFSQRLDSLSNVFPCQAVVTYGQYLVRGGGFAPVAAPIKRTASGSERTCLDSPVRPEGIIKPKPGSA